MQAKVATMKSANPPIINAMNQNKTRLVFIQVYFITDSTIHDIYTHQSVTQ